MFTLRFFAVFLLISLVPIAGKSSIVPCGGTFDEFIETVKQEALDRGTSQETIDGFLASVEHDPDVI
ncbi:MAG: hypothetical protein OXF95_04305, partial [Rhodobacteraceae bacterium]|nr:hypothetical protein [Paracoccaceae bacterium]